MHGRFSLSLNLVISNSAFHIIYFKSRKTRDRERYNHCFTPPKCMYNIDGAGPGRSQDSGIQFVIQFKASCMMAGIQPIESSLFASQRTHLAGS